MKCFTCRHSFTCVNNVQNKTQQRPVSENFRIFWVQLLLYSKFRPYYWEPFLKIFSREFQFCYCCCFENSARSEFTFCYLINFLCYVFSSLQAGGAEYAIQFMTDIKKLKYYENESTLICLISTNYAIWINIITSQSRRYFLTYLE